MHVMVSCSPAHHRWMYIPCCSHLGAATPLAEVTWLPTLVTKLPAPDRERQELSRCRCIAAWSACLETLPLEDIDIPWAPKQASSSKLGGDAGAVGQNYLTWSMEYSKHVQVNTDNFADCQYVLLDALSCLPALSCAQKSICSSVSALP